MPKEAYTIKQFYNEQPFPGGPYDLSLHISAHSFAYAIFTSDFKSLAGLCEIRFADALNANDDLTEMISFLVQNYFLHQKKFEKVNIAILNYDFCLVPEAFAPEGSLKPLLKFTTGAGNTKNTLAHHIKDLRFSYTVNAGLSDYLEKTFVNASIRHAGAVNLSLFFSQHSLADANLFMSINESSVELAIKENDILLFYNIFKYQGNEDILYYLLFTMEQFSLNPLNIKLLLAAQLPVSDELIKSIKKYIKNVSFCVNNRSLVLRDEPARLPQHYYFTLLNQHTCEL